MFKLAMRGTALILFCSALSLHAATISVTTAKDEANDLKSEPAAGDNYPLSTGCSLREALQNIIDAGNNVSPQTYANVCTPADGGAAANTIDLSGLGSTAYMVNGTVPDPTDITGVATVNNGSLPAIMAATTYGSVTIQNGTISCFSDPSASPAIPGVIMVNEAAGGNATFSAVTFSNCTAPAGGVAITNNNGGGGDLTLTGVMFTGIRGTSQANGGCITHGSGNLTITGGTFTGCVTDNGGTIPGTGGGNGGAIAISDVGGTTAATISGVTFTGNLAGGSGGAIYLENTDVITITGAAFSANIANGNTNSTTSPNAELGGGAIFATGTASLGNTGTGGLHASDFLIFNSSFIGNSAPTGTGGAIILTGSGNLTYGSAAFNGTTILNKQIPGGIVASNFSGNTAGGTWNGTPVDPRAGSGGAIYASGNLSIVDSSFVGGNTSSHASGGAISYYDVAANFSPMAISNVTFNANSAALDGGAIANLVDGGKITLINDTLSGNSAGAGGGGAFYNASTTPTDVNVSNTIFDSSSSGGNCAGNTFTDVVGNLQFNPASGCASIANTGNPSLQSATVFGGANALVLVMKLNSGSAASGAGDPTTCSASPIDNLDEALNTRPQGRPNCDVGAFESPNVQGLAITKSHTDPFTQGDTGDTYTITASNNGTDSTSGTVTVTDTLPAGLTATNMTGNGWTCTLGTLTCTRSDVLSSGSSYPAITLTVNVAANATGPVTNTASALGGGAATPAPFNDPTNIKSKTTPVTLQSFDVD